MEKERARFCQAQQPWQIKYEINFQMQNLLELEPDTRAKEGIFLEFQYPVEVPGVSNFNFLHTAFNAVLQHQGSEPMLEGEFREFLFQKMKLVGLNHFPGKIQRI